MISFGIRGMISPDGYYIEFASLFNTHLGDMVVLTIGEFLDVGHYRFIYDITKSGNDHESFLRL